MTRTELVRVLALMGEMWPNWQQPGSREQAELRVEAWQRLVGDLPAQPVLAAIESLATEGSQFAPAPGEVRLTTMRLLSPAGGVPTAEEAWGEVLAKISSVGYTTGLDICELGDQCKRLECEHRVVKFSHPAVRRAVDGLGWQYLCQSENQMADRAHFMKFYGSAVEAQKQREAVPLSVQELLGGKRPEGLEAAT